MIILGSEFVCVCVFYVNGRIQDVACAAPIDCRATLLFDYQNLQTKLRLDRAPQSIPPNM